MKSIMYVLLVASLSFLVLGPSTYAQDTYDDTDGDGIADPQDVCPYDAKNFCRLAKDCWKTQHIIDTANGVSVILGVGAIAYWWLVPVGIGSGLAALGGVVVAEIYSRKLEKLGCHDVVGWRDIISY